MQKTVIFFVLILVLPVSAIVVQDYTVAETAPAGLDWSYVYNYKGSSAVAVGGSWLLTAAHVADDGGDGSLPNAPGYQQQEIIYHPNADLALVRYDQAFTSYYSLYTSGNPTEDLPGLEVLMVGFGNTGTVSADYYTDSGTGRGTKRWGSQIIDRTSIKRYDSNGTVGFTENSGFLMEFDLGDTSHEAGGATGDSGGGVFYNDGGVWKLAGIMTSRSSAVPSQYIGTFAVATTEYADWITDTIPEPAAVGMMGFGTIGLFLYRAKRRRKMPGRSFFPIRGGEPMCDRVCAMAAEGEADSEGRIHDYLTGMQEMVNASPLAVWMNTLHARYNALNKAIWRFITAAVEQSSVRKEAAGERVNKAAVKSLDVFLKKISWERLVISVRSGRTIAARSLRMSVLKSLDVFLAKISWDQITAAYMRCKKAIRFSSRR